MLAFLLPTYDWASCSIKNEDEAVFKKAFKDNKDVLLGCMAASWFWILFWKKRLKEISESHIAFVFSGSFIYSYAFLALCRTTSTPAYVIESLFTGNNFFCEERYHPIANKSKIKNKNYFNYLIHREKDKISINREIVKGLNELRGMKNKNVTQPEPTTPPHFKNKGDIVLIAGQVINDFSLINNDEIHASSIYTYIVAIDRIINETELNVIVKCHPWEHKKDNLKKALTFEILNAWLQTKPEIIRDRVKIIENFNLNVLLSVSSHFITICSQAGLEAAAAGLKPIIIGSSFYSEKGFTLECKTPSEIGKILSSKTPPSFLSIEEYKKFEEFFMVLTRLATYKNTPEGVNKLQREFIKMSPIAWTQSQNTSELSAGI